MNIYVGNLNYKVEEKKLQEAFEVYGAVESVKLIEDKLTGRSKGFGFVEMTNDSEGKVAIENLNGTDFMGRTMVVNIARQRE